MQMIKKILLLLFVILFSLFLTGCGEGTLWSLYIGDNNHGLIGMAQGGVYDPSLRSIYSNYQCQDTDGGLNYYLKGTVSGEGGGGGFYTSADFCVNENLLIEGRCLNGSVNIVNYQCPNGCHDGACIEEEINECVDSDDRKNYYRLGYAYDDVNYRINQPAWDYCSNGILFESYCDSEGFVAYEEYNCPFGCDEITRQCIKGTGKSCLVDRSSCGGGIHCGVVEFSEIFSEETCVIPAVPASSHGGPVGTIGISFQSLSSCDQVYPCSDGCESNYICKNNVNTVNSITNVICNETDNGIDYNTKGTTYFGAQVSTDFCIGNSLREFYCESNITNNYIMYVCPNGCWEGACIVENNTDNSSNDSIVIPDEIQEIPEENVSNQSVRLSNPQTSVYTTWNYISPSSVSELLSSYSLVRDTLYPQSISVEDFFYYWRFRYKNFDYKLELISSSPFTGNPLYDIIVLRLNDDEIFNVNYKNGVILPNHPALAVYYYSSNNMGVPQIKISELYYLSRDEITLYANAQTSKDIDELKLMKAGNKIYDVYLRGYSYDEKVTLYINQHMQDFTKGQSFVFDNVLNITYVDMISTGQYKFIFENLS